jgi:transposase-like protein
VQRYSELVDRFKTDERLFRAIFVDGTHVQIEEGYWIWIADEPALNSCLILMHLSRKRTMIFVCYQFFKKLRDRFGRRKPRFIDRATWYNDEVCRCLRLQ